MISMCMYEFRIMLIEIVLFFFQYLPIAFNKLFILTCS